MVLFITPLYYSIFIFIHGLSPPVNFWPPLYIDELQFSEYYSLSRKGVFLGVWIHSCTLWNYHNKVLVIGSLKICPVGSIQIQIYSLQVPIHFCGKIPSHFFDPIFCPCQGPSCFCVTFPHVCYPLGHSFTPWLWLAPVMKLLPMYDFHALTWAVA